MDDNVFFSIIMPVYNGEEYLAECIDSVLAQEYRNFELIAVNDGSTDKSLDILNLYKEKDSRIIIYSIENSGVSNARNIGLHNAKGEYVVFLDCDDIIASDALAKFATILNNHSAKIDIIFATQKVFEEVLSKPVEVYAPKVQDELTTDSVFKMCFMREIHNVVWGNTYRMELIKANNIFFEKSYAMNEDGDWLFKMVSKSSQYKIIKDTTYYQRRNPGAKNYNKVGKKYAESSFKVNAYWYDYFKNEYMGASKDAIMHRIANSYLFSAFRMDNLSDIEFKEMKKLYLSRKDILKDVAGAKNKAVKMILDFFGVKIFLKVLVLAIKLSNRKN